MQDIKDFDYFFSIKDNILLTYREIKRIRLIVGSGFDSNFWNRLDSTVSILEIDSTRLDFRFQY